MKTVRCKMTCVETRDLSDGQGHTAKFLSVYSGSPENDAFFRATPAADLSLQVFREQHFEKDKDYFVDISPAE